MAAALCYNEPKVGDLIEIDRFSYKHWALYMGNGDVIHLAPPSELSDAGFSSIMSIVVDKAYVKMEPLHRVAGVDNYRVNNKLDRKYPPRPVHLIVKEAREQEGKELSYSVVSMNCEHFVMHLRYGVSQSSQVDEMVTKTGVVLSVGLIGMLCYHLLKPQQKYKK
ncbi:phospholipase A and acyltransferase 2-like [Narcine bancroftii]|uniref:phospholipase A and acyltransferase 2-like n=1 Tax=Narcine bancroftii TaxID=1343680 RepID=UPI0038317E3C